MSDWKNNRNASYLKYISKIAEYLNVSTDYLLGNEQKEQNLENDIKFVLFNGSDNITDEMFEEVKNFAKYVQQRETEKNGHK